MKERRYNLFRRIMAWLMLVFFILLLVNIMIFRLYLAESVMAYITLVALFFFLKGFGRGGTVYEAKEDEGGRADPENTKIAGASGGEDRSQQG